MMGGNIKVKSELGKGSEITIGLRFKTTSATKNRGVIQELNGFRALVADDNMDSCVSVEKMLRTIGLRPEWTTSGKEAVFRAKYATEQNDPFHVYIIDWLMPDMNGVEVVRRIRSEIGDEVPIMTGRILRMRQEKQVLRHFVPSRCFYRNFMMCCKIPARQAVLAEMRSLRRILLRAGRYFW